MKATLADLLVIVTMASMLPGCGDPLTRELTASQQSKLTGTAAPDFTLKDPQDKDLRLNDLKGKWVVLYFYEKNDTPVCACDANEYTQLLGELGDIKDAQVCGISSHTARENKAFAKAYSLKLTALADPDRTVMKQYGASSNRATFIIDPEGKIRAHWPHVFPKDHAARVASKLAALQGKAPTPATAPAATPTTSSQPSPRPS